MVQHCATDMTTYRLNWSRGRFSENVAHTKLKKEKGVLDFMIAPHKYVDNIALRHNLLQYIDLCSFSSTHFSSPYQKLMSLFCKISFSLGIYKLNSFLIIHPSTFKCRGKIKNSLINKMVHQLTLPCTLLVTEPCLANSMSL